MGFRIESPTLTPTRKPSPTEKPLHAAKQSKSAKSCHWLILILGDQLAHDSPALADAAKDQDVVMFAEVREESSHVPSHKQRTTLFLSAMRHRAAELSEEGYHVRYTKLNAPDNTGSLRGELERAIHDLKPQAVVMVEPGDHRLRAQLNEVALAAKVEIRFLPDTHFLTSHAEFEAWVKGRKELTMEYFYREQRRRLGILVDDDGKPEGGVWNFDSDNRETFPSTGPSPRPKPPLAFEPDEIVREVIELVNTHLPTNPGRLESFRWLVTRQQGLAALKDFIDHRLDRFGPYEDAMWTDEPFTYHSTLSPALNLKLISPLECVNAALAAHTKGKARLQSVEAFIRQIIGWREFIRGVYYLEGEDYEQRNFLNQHGALPDFYWTGNTDMACMSECLNQVLDRGYGHHIQRLMVIGNFALISGVHPRDISDWFQGMYIDGIDWVTLPNTLGMVMHADGTAQRKPVVGTKPYCASGQYIKRMSNYCKKCKYDPAKRTGTDACPFTVFYWDFLQRNQKYLAKNPRMATILTNLGRFGDEQLTQITVTATSLRSRFKIGDITQSASHPRPNYAKHDYSAPTPTPTTQTLFSTPTSNPKVTHKPGKPKP